MILNHIKRVKLKATTATMHYLVHIGKVSLSAVKQVFQVLPLENYHLLSQQLFLVKSVRQMKRVILKHLRMSVRRIRIFESKSWSNLCGLKRETRANNGNDNRFHVPNSQEKHCPRPAPCLQAHFPLIHVPWNSLEAMVLFACAISGCLVEHLNPINVGFIDVQHATAAEELSR